MASPDNEPNAAHPSGSSGAAGIAQDAASAASDIAHQAAGQAQQHAQAFLSEQKGLAADHIDGVVKVLHDTVDQLRQRSPGAVTDYAERAVDGLDSVAHALREQDVRTLVGQVEDFARRQPVLFVAGTVAIGFAFARFLKSSSRSSYENYGQGSEHGQGHRASSHASQPAQSGTEFSRHMDTDPNRSSASPSTGNGRQAGQESG